MTLYATDCTKVACTECEPISKEIMVPDSGVLARSWASSGDASTLPSGDVADDDQALWL